MNCSEFKIWTETVSESEIISAGNDVLTHTASCVSCAVKLTILQNSINFMFVQKSSTLSDIKAKELVALLSEMSQPSFSQKKVNGYSINKLAVAAVIIFGIITGALAGGLLTSDTNNENTVWNSEFTLLSDNSSTNTTVFD